MPELASESRSHDRQLHGPDPGQGVFETLLVIDGRPVELEAHLTRLESSLAELFPGQAPPPTLRDVPSLLHPYGHLSDGTSAQGSLRVTVAPDPAGGLGVRISLRKVGAALALDPPPVALHSLTLPGGLGAHKWADRTLVDEAQSRLPADALPLIVDRDGSVLEASRANVFAVQKGGLLTPPTDGRILPGVTRMRIIELTGALEIETREAPLSRDDLLAADEVFLTGSVRGIERVHSLDGIALPPRGEVVATLAAELHRTWLGAQVG